MTRNHQYSRTHVPFTAKGSVGQFEPTFSTTAVWRKHTTFTLYYDPMHYELQLAHGYDSRSP